MENVRGLVQHLHLTHLHIWLDQNASVPDSPHWLKKSQKKKKKKDLKLFTFHPVYKPSCRKSSNCSWVHFLVCVISELITIAFHVRCCHCGYKPKDKKERSVFAKLMTCEVEDERVVGRVLWGSFDNMFGFVRTWKENLNVNVEVISDFVCSFPLCVSVFVFFFPSLLFLFSYPLPLTFLPPPSHFPSSPFHFSFPSSPSLLIPHLTFPFLPLTSFHLPLILSFPPTHLSFPPPSRFPSPTFFLSLFFYVFPLSSFSSCFLSSLVLFFSLSPFPFALPYVSSLSHCLFPSFSFLPSVILSLFLLHQLFPHPHVIFSPFSPYPPHPAWFFISLYTAHLPILLNPPPLLL